MSDRSAVDIAIEEADGDPFRSIASLLAEVERMTWRLALGRCATSYGLPGPWAGRGE